MSISSDKILAPLKSPGLEGGSLGASSSSPYPPSSPSSSRSIADQSWYHGKVTRVRSEALVKTNGDFLVRDSISSPGEFVLTAFWKKPLHFQVNTARDRSGQKVYQFEEEEFESVVDLITFYASHRRPVTLGTGCLIARGIDKELEEEVLSAVGPSQELEAQYARIFRKGGAPTHETTKSLNRTAMVNWASRCSLAATSPATSTMTLNRPSALGAGSTANRMNVPSSLLKIGIPQPRRSPPTKSAAEEDYDEMDYDTMEPLPQSPHISGARSVFNGHAPQGPSSVFEFHFESSPLRPTQSCDALHMTWRQNSTPPSPARTLLSPPSFSSPSSSSPRPLSASDTSSDSGARADSGLENISPDSSMDRGSSVLDHGEEEKKKKKERDSGVLEDDYDVPRTERAYSLTSSSRGQNAPTAQRHSIISASSSSHSSMPISLPSTSQSSFGSSSLGCGTIKAAPSKDADPDYDEPRSNSHASRANSPAVLTPQTSFDGPRKPPMSNGAPPPIAPKPVFCDGPGISQVAMQRLRNFVGDRQAGELAAILGAEDARLLGMVEETIDESRTRGVGSLLLSSGAERREIMRTRCRHIQIAVALSILSPPAAADATRILTKWIGVASHALKRTGNHFTFANIMRALTAQQLDIARLWWLDPHARDDFKTLAAAYRMITVDGSYPAEAVACSIPLLQPLLDIFDSSGDVTSSYLDRRSPAKEIASTFRWLDAARSWYTKEEEYRMRCTSHFGAQLNSTRRPADSALSHHSLTTIVGSVSMPKIHEYIEQRKTTLFES